MLDEVLRGNADQEPDARASLAQALAGLNTRQRAACLHPGGPLLIVAGPGSGKTRVITCRIAWLVQERGVAPSEILAITFTNKAAREMRERVERLMGGLGGAWVGTFHATCARILRQQIDVLDGWTRDFSIYDSSDKALLIKRILKDLGLDPARFRPAAISGWISSLKNASSFAEDIDEASIDGFAFEAVRKAYAEELRKANALDFDDLLLKVLELFSLHPGLRDAWSQRFRHVLVDEYQDTNRVQYELVRHFASAHGNVTVCGDPDQSIYAWRGADIRNILDFESDFPGAQRVLLEQNYRSRGHILTAASALISHNAQRLPKGLWSEASAGQKLSVLECADENDEASEIAAQIHSLARQGVSPSQCAIFYRANFMQRALEAALRLANISYRVVGGLEFYARAEIRDLIAYLRLMVNPADDVAFRRVVNSPSRGIGETSLEKLIEWAKDRRLPLSEACRSEEVLRLLRGKAKAGLQQFAELLGQLAPAADAPAAVALDLVLAAINVERWLAEMEGDLDRSENVEELRAHAAAYDHQTPGAGLRGFLQDVALVSEVDELVENTEGTRMMTLHSAKGLEFDCVFIAGVEEELLPHARAVAEVNSGRDGIEEERRLFYVGLTRARERLFLSHVRTRHAFGAPRYAAPSRFLDEIPRELIEGYASEADEAALLGEFVAPPQAAELRVGDRVEHAAFGIGRIEALVGSGPNARATVKFQHQGTRQLLLSYAKLVKVGPAHA